MKPDKPAHDPSPVHTPKDSNPKPKKRVQNNRSREVRRYSHDLYVDQMETLSTKTRGYFFMQGKNKTVVQMLREAIDEYIQRNQ